MIDVAAGRQRRRVRVVLLEDLDERALGPGPGQQLGRVREVVGAEHDVDVRRPLAHELAVLLGEAAAHRDLQIGPRFLQLLEPAEMAVELVVGVLPDAARVQHDDIGGSRSSVGSMPVGDEQPGDPLGVVLVHLAPVGAHEEAAGHGRQCTRRRQTGPVRITGPRNVRN